jgi:hypothetical protein
LERIHASEHESAVPCRRADRLQFRESPNEASDGNCALHASKRGPKAVMGSTAESEVASGVGTAQVELIGR